MLVTKPIINIVNVVASATIEQTLDLYKILQKFPDSEYHPEQFPGLVFRLKNPKTSILIFRSGKFVCTGGKSEEMARKAVKLVIQQLRKNEIKIKKDAVVTIQNVVASINLRGIVNIEQTARTLPRSMYEPEQFPGVIHRMIHPKTVLLIFVTGKIICVGAKSKEDVYTSVNSLHHFLEEKELINY